MKDMLDKIIIVLVVILLIIGLLVKTKNNSKDNILDFKEPSNITMSIKDNSLTESQATVIITDNTGNDNTYSISFRLDKKVNNKWEKLKIINSDYGFNEIGYKVDENNKLELVQNWEHIYGKLDKGDYRLVKSILNSNKKVYFSTEFTIK